MSYAPLAAQVQCEYRLYKFTADPHFGSVEPGEFTRVKSKSYICKYLKTIRIEINRLFCYVRSELSADLYISKCTRHCLQSFDLNVSSVFN